MDFGLNNRIALVCGGSKGIGYAAAEHLAREGATVVICAREQASIDSALTRLHAVNKTASGVAADLSTLEGIATTVKAVNEKFGRVDILVTNTGGPTPGPVLSHDWSAWESATSLLLRSAVELTRAFVPGMRERQWGRVIGVTSMAVKHPMPSLVLSNSLRAAVTGYFRSLADEVARDGVTVNTMLPGYIETDRLVSLAGAAAKRTGNSEEAIFDGYRAVTPAGRLGKPEECGAMIAFLASQHAAFVTGQAISVDGGFGHSLL